MRSKAYKKVDGLYRKPRLTANTKVPFLIWLPVILIIVTVLIILSLRTVILQNEPGPTLSLARKHSWKVVAVGDLACDTANTNYNDGNGIIDGCKQKFVGRALEREKVDAVLLLGDLQYQTGSFEEFEWSCAVFSLYKSTNLHRSWQSRLWQWDYPGWRLVGIQESL